MIELKYSKSKIIEVIFYISIFFPYLTFFTKKIDTSPYALLIATLFIISIKKLKLTKEFIVLFLLFISSIFIFFIGNKDLISIRIIVGYYSIFIVSYAVYYVYKLNKFMINKELFYLFTKIWFFVGLVQTILYPEFMTFLIDRSTSGGGRGVTGLAPEPTYYGTVAIFLFFVSYITKYKLKETIILTLIMIVFFSKSTTSVLLFFLFLFIYFILFITNKKSIIYIFLLIILILIVTTSGILNETRLYFLISEILKNPLIIFMADESMNARIWYIIGSFTESYNNYFLPHGYGVFREDFIKLLNVNSEYVHDYTYFVATNKIMSGLGQMLYEIGFLTFVYIGLFYWLSYKYFGNFKESLFITLSFFISLITAIPLVLPFIGFLYGLLIVLSHQKYNKLRKEVNAQCNNVSI